MMRSLFVVGFLLGRVTVPALFVFVIGGWRCALAFVVGAVVGGWR